MPIISRACPRGAELHRVVEIELMYNFKDFAIVETILRIQVELPQ